MKKNSYILLSLALSTLLFASCNKPQDGGATNPSGASSPAAVGSPVASGSPTSAATPTADSGNASGFMLVNSKGAAVEFDPTSTKVDLRRDTKKSTIVIGTYDFKLAPMSANSIEPLTAPEQKRIHVGVDATKGEGVSYEKPLPPGEYQATFVDVLTFDGAESRENFENEKGTITITESDDNQVKGKIDITADGGAKVQGEFVADVVK